jgi:hypothetical protein
MWIYSQRTGELYWEHPPVRELIGTGYSGAGSLKNDPAMQCISDLGPIPRGEYTIGPIGAYGPGGVLKSALPLTPDPSNDMCSPPRSNFLIHGDSAQHPGWASGGCIIMALSIRQKISQSGDNRLRVVKG